MLPHRPSRSRVSFDFDVVTDTRPRPSRAPARDQGRPSPGKAPERATRDRAPDDLAPAVAGSGPKAGDG